MKMITEKGNYNSLLLLLGIAVWITGGILFLNNMEFGNPTHMGIMTIMAMVGIFGLMILHELDELKEEKK